MADADFWADGKWNFFCDLCGRKQKSSRAMKTWQGLYVCRHHKEIRNPQDFLRGVKDDQSVPWTRPEKIPETSVQFCTLQGINAIPGFAIPGCATPSFVNLAFAPSLVQWSGWALQDTNGNFLLDTNGNMIFPPHTPTVTNPFPWQRRLDVDFFLDFSALS